MNQDEEKTLGKKQDNRLERSHINQSKLNSDPKKIIQSAKKLNCPCHWRHGRNVRYGNPVYTLNSLLGQQSTQVT